MKKITVSVFILCAFVVMFVSYFVNVHKNISSSLIRMHVIANSDTFNDQQIKLDIRDRILENYSFAARNIKGEMDYIENNLEDINKDVNSWLESMGVPYGAKVYLTKDYFPTKKYGGLCLPKGEYTAFKVVLGDGKGKNWWCVMFPPLCFADSSVGGIDEKSDEYLKNNLSESEYKLVTGSGTQIRFKILEFINSSI